jgi:hypothetical protein
MARKLVLLTYDIKPGSRLEEYEEYTRSVDYPVFRQNDRIQDYANYVVRDTVRGEAERFRHFDLMFVDSLDAFHADGKLHFGDPKILEHAKRWREKWGMDPSTGWNANVTISYADEIHG